MAIEASRRRSSTGSSRRSRTGSVKTAEHGIDPNEEYRPAVARSRREQMAEDTEVVVNDLTEMSWRTGSPFNFSDWRIIVNGTIVYNVHRNIVGAGTTCSRVLRRAMLSSVVDKVSSGKFGILDSLVHKMGAFHLHMPTRVYAVFEPVLDFFYTGEIEVDVHNCVPLLHLTHLLDIPSLATILEEFIQRELETESSLDLLIDLLELKPKSADAQSLFETCIVLGYGSVARNFSALASNKLARLPLDVLLSILSHELLVASPCEICNCVTAYLRLRASKNYTISADNFLALAQFVTEVPNEDALFLLHYAVRFQLDDLKAICLKTVAANFDQLRMEDAAALQVSTINQLLSMDELNVKHEDSVFEFLSSYARVRLQKESGISKSHPVKSEMYELWGGCRFPFLSLHNLKHSHTDLPIPPEYVTEGLLLRSLRVDKKWNELEKYVERFEMGSAAYIRTRPRKSYASQVDGFAEGRPLRR